MKAADSPTLLWSSELAVATLANKNEAGKRSIVWRDSGYRGFGECLN